MSDSYYYVYTDTGRFAKISDRPLNDPTLTRVDTLPPSGSHKLVDGEWIALTEAEIIEALPEEEREDTGKEIITPRTTTKNAIALWNDLYGETLKDSNASITSDGLSVNGFYYVNGDRLSLDHFVQGEPFEGATIVIKNGAPTWSLPPFTWVYSVAINSGNIGNSDLRRQNGTVTTNCNYVLGYSGRIERITMENRANDNDDWDLRLFINNSEVGSFYKPPNQPNKVKVFKAEEIDITFKEADTFYLRCDNRGSGNIAYPGSSLYLREIFD